MALTTAVHVLVFTLLYVAVVLGQNGWGVTYSTQSICVLKGSTVELSCTYKYPSGHKVASTFWFTRDFVNLSDEPDYRGRVTYRNNTNNHTLMITDLRESDSAEYKFRFITDQTGGKWFGQPGVKLTVKGLQVKLTPATVTEGQNVTLTCITSCPLTDTPTYIWYKKNVTSPKASGQSYSISNITSEDSGEYYCEAQNIYGRPNSSTVSVDVQYAPKNILASVSPSGEIVEGSSVSLTCTSDANPPVDKYTWYKKNVTSPKASGQSYSITNITSEDSGEYYCEATNAIGNKTSAVVCLMVLKKQSYEMLVVVGITVVILVLILCLSGFICFRKKAPKSVPDTKDKSDNEQGNPNPTNCNISSVGVTSEKRDQSDDLHYTGVDIHRAKMQDVPLYSNAQTQEQDEDVQYAAVKFNPPSAATQPAMHGVEEEPSVLYSTVNILRINRT
ncbi:B-cell receptor CD22-like [Esox lucius]|uniref:Ig-like domain-containing protein n=1 Tax=Esox lucius TaxID=8010 RepID=A0AAY5L1F4_ESOLU|nr:B-cell receptor CD22-like [Esox lucius]